MRPILLAAAVFVTPAGAAHAASVNCPPSATHPVCKANYAAYPRGNHPDTATGTATVNGRQVQWTCKTGSDNPPKPRSCSW